jgi:quercetin dioxygenase-like cupin family protein
VAHRSAAARSERPRRAVVQQRVGIGPEATPVEHIHPGEEITYILDGSLEYQIEGQPTRTWSAGDALTVPAGVVHAVRNALPLIITHGWDPTASRKRGRS